MNGVLGYGPMDIDNCYVEVESVSGSEYVVFCVVEVIEVVVVVEVI